jgi:DNA-binding protein HU-beta
VNKAELIAAVAEGGGTKYPKSVVAGVLGSLEIVTGGALASGEEILLPGIGKLTPVKKAARNARNPRTGETIAKPATTVVKFRVAKSLKDRVA